MHSVQPFSLHFKTNTSLVMWEVAALRKTGGFTIPQNNFYYPPDEEGGEAPGVDSKGSAMTVTSTNPNDNSICYKYLFLTSYCLHPF
jgi:hypothetical protein